MVKKDNQEMVQLALDTHKWINTPIIYTELGKDFSLIQQDIMNMISGHLQEYVKQFLNEQRYKDPENPKPIFTKEQIEEGLKDIRIDLSELRLGDTHYVRADTALEALKKLHVLAPIFEEGTGQRMATTWFPVFEAITIPQTTVDEEVQIKNNPELAKRRMGYISVDINRRVAAYVFDMSNGYFNHMERIAYYCNNAHTSRIYMKLMAELSKGNKCPVIPYMDLRHFLGMERIDGPKKIREEQAKRKLPYPKFAQFKQKVLEVAKRDMIRLRDKAQIDITFEYELIYKGRAQRGNPEAIRFIVSRTPLGIARDALLHRSSAETKVIASLRKRYPEIGKESLKELFSTVADNNFEDFKTFAYKGIDQAVERPHKWGGSVSSYVLYLLQTKRDEYIKIEKEQKAAADLFAEQERETAWHDCHQYLLTNSEDDPDLHAAFSALTLESITPTPTHTIILLATTARAYETVETKGIKLFSKALRKHFTNPYLRYRINEE